MVRSLRSELPSVRALTVDVPAGWTPGVEALDLLARELAACAGVEAEGEVVWDASGGRFVPRLVVSRRPLGSGPAVSSDGTYVITGGTGGLGLVTARWLVERGARYVALLSRSGVVGADISLDDWRFIREMCV